MNLIWQKIKKHKWAILLVSITVLVCGFVLYDSLTANSITPALKPIKKKTEEKVRAPISGRLVSKAESEKEPISVVIENHPDARPQSGLNEASLVIETFAEGGITRFLVFYQENEPKEIGPVRSARDYFVEWAYAYKVPFAHVGGNADALNLLKKLGVFDVNQFYFGGFFWRDNTRYAPHNVYTTYQKIISAAKTKKYALDDFDTPAFLFKNDAKKEERPASQNVSVNFNSNFAVKWAYNPENNSYVRSILGVVQKDRPTKKEITAKNIIVGFSDFSNGRSVAGEQKVNIRTTGTGKAVFFVDGAKNTGTWKRQAGQIMRFYNENGEELKLNAGTTWIEFVPTGTTVN